MFGTRKDERESGAWLKEARATYEGVENPLVDVKFRAVVSSVGSSLSVADESGNVCTVSGPVPEPARTVQLESAVLAQRLAKTGGTPYRCVEVRTQVEPGLIISASAINGMRRDALNQLTAIRGRREQPQVFRPRRFSEVPGPKGMPGLSIQVTSKEQLTQKLLKLETVMLYVPLHILDNDPELTKKLLTRGRLAAVLPRIIHDNEMPKTRAALMRLKELGLTDVLVGNLGHLIPVRELGLRIRGDFGLNIYNSGAVDMTRKLEFASTMLSFEMTMPQIRDVTKSTPCELLVYGRMPLMVTENCLFYNRAGECVCNRGAMKLTDKTGAEFPIIKDGDSCRSVLLNGKKLSWLDRQEDLQRLGLWATRLYFTTENAGEVDRVLSAYIHADPFDPGACTRGLYLRGVD